MIQEMIKSYHTKKRSTKTAANESDDENTSPVDASPDDELMSEEIDAKSRQMLFDSNKDVAGVDMYGFHTPKKRNGMAILAENTPTTDMRNLSLASPRTPKGRSKLSERHLKTPSTNMKSLLMNSPRTPKSKSLVLNTKTPQATREKLKQAGRKKTQEAESYTDDEDPSFKESSEESSESEASSSEESSEDSDNENSRRSKVNTNRREKYEAEKQPVVAVSSGRRSTRILKNKTAQEEFIPDSDNYFRSVSSKMVFVYIIGSVSESIPWR